MKETVTKSMFMDSFTGGYRDNFSFDGKMALFEYLEEYEDSCSEELELDPIGFCCEFNEYENLEEFQENYNKVYKTIEDIEEDTTVIRIRGTERFIISVF